MILNTFLLVQYLPRLYQIHVLSKQLTKHVGIWLKGVFFLCMYILASHVSSNSLIIYFTFLCFYILVDNA